MRNFDLNPLYRSTLAFDNDFPALRPRSRGKMIDDLRMTIDDWKKEAQDFFIRQS